MKRQQLHYGEERMSVGSILNWKGTRYIVVSVDHMEDTPDRIVSMEQYTYRVAGYAHMAYRSPSHALVSGDKVSRYTLRALHSRTGALYTVNHEGGYITRPTRTSAVSAVNNALEVAQ